MKNYEIKTEVGQEANKIKKQLYKIILLSSYGKIEEYVKGHYEINEETGVVQFVKDEIKKEGE